MLIYPNNVYTAIRKQLSIPTRFLGKKKLDGQAYDELTLEKLMRYYGFERRRELLQFLKKQRIEN